MMRSPIAELPEHRVPVDCPQLLGRDAECIVCGHSVILRDEVAGSTVWLSSYDFVERTGKTLRFCSRPMPMPPGAIEFGGLGGPARFDVTFPDERIAAAVVALIRLPIELLP